MDKSTCVCLLQQCPIFCKGGSQCDRLALRQAYEDQVDTGNQVMRICMTVQEIIELNCMDVYVKLTAKTARSGLVSLEQKHAMKYAYKQT